VPWGNSSLIGRGFVFKQEEPVRQEQPRASDADQANIEIAYWNSIKDAGDPKLLEAYLTEFPNGRFVRLAEIMIDTLTAVQKPVSSARRDQTVEQKAEPEQKVAVADPKQEP